ncbi:HIT-like protein [Thozetella sp. PMI_491]|nr:HIT-like protein [Thozetella sp. PMI_491]
MSTNSPSTIHFGPFAVTSQVFLTTPYSFALVNLKPLLPGHVLVCPLQRHYRLTDLSAPELTDLFQTVQRVQRMLARHYFAQSPSSSAALETTDAEYGGSQPVPPEAGSFNIAIQDGPGAGQTVSHVHVQYVFPSPNCAFQFVILTLGSVIPRIRGRTAKAEGDGPTDELYEHMAAEDGNIGGALWDREHAATTAGEPKSRPVPGGQFPRIEDCDRAARSMEEMEAEAAMFRSVLRQMESDEAR